MNKTRILIMVIAFGLAAGFAFANGDGEEAAAGDGPAVLAGYQSVTVEGLNVQWQVDGANLNVQLTAKTTGWVAVGFDPSNKMKDANIIFGYVKDGVASLRDDFGVAQVRHGSDAELGGTDNLSNGKGSEVDGVTQVSFTIPLDSGDKYDKKLVAGNEYKIIIAYGPDGADDFGTYHATRSSTNIKL